MPEPDFDEAAWRERIREFREEKDAFLATNPESPLGDDYDGVEYFDLDPDFRVVARFQRARDPESVSLSVTRGPDREYERAATFGFTFDGDHHVLAGFRAVGSETFFVPFRDATSGGATPREGRYLDVDVEDAETGDDVVLDFNLAALPFCAFSDEYASTVPPAENELDVAVRAGEKRPAEE